MITRIIAIALGASLTLASGFLYFQSKQLMSARSEVTRLLAATQIQSATIQTLQNERDADREKVTRVTVERNILDQKLREITDAKILDFLNTPVPDSLRDTVRNYYDAKVTDNRMSH